MNNSKDLIKLFCDTKDPEKMEKLFNEMFTEREQKDFNLRWDLMKDLYQGIPQREIASKHQISLCKITRGSKILKEENSYIKKVLSDKFDDHLHL